MNATRRSPHPLHGNTYELQTFECRACGLEIKRSSDVSGLPHATEAAPNGRGRNVRTQQAKNYSRCAVLVAFAALAAFIISVEFG